MSNELKYVYGLHTCLAQIKANSKNIRKIFIKKPPYNKNLNNIIQIAKDLSLQIDEINKEISNSAIAGANDLYAMDLPFGVSRSLSTINESISEDPLGL